MSFLRNTDLAGNRPHDFPSPAKKVHHKDRPTHTCVYNVLLLTVGTHRTIFQDTTKWHTSHRPLPDLPWKWKGNTSEMCSISGSLSPEDVAFWSTGKGSITHGKYVYSCQIILIPVLLLSWVAESGESSLQTKSENQEVSQRSGLFIRFVWKYRDDYDLLTFLNQVSTPWPQSSFWNLKHTKQWVS